MVKRTYRSALRQQQASETRAKIVCAANELFSRDGFDSTTIAAIAVRAGVAGSTIYTIFGSKLSIVATQLDQLNRDATSDAAWEALAHENDLHRKLELVGNWYRRLYSAGRTVLEATYEARQNPAVRVLHERHDRASRVRHAELVDQIARRGLLTTSLSEAEAIERMWALCGPELYLSSYRGVPMVRRCLRTVPLRSPHRPALGLSQP